MVQYIKLKLNKKIDRTFACYAILAKAVNNNRVYFCLYHKNGDMPGCVEGDTAGSFSIGLSTFAVTEGALRAILIPGEPIDSFETILLKERLRSGSPLANYEVNVMGDILTGDEVFTVYFDDLFVVERRSEQQTQGVLIKSGYTSDEIYSGFGSYHSNQTSHRFNTPLDQRKPYLIGIELEIYAKDQSCFERITRARTNWFQCERDGSLSQRVKRTTNSNGKVEWIPANDGVGNLGIEIKTIPLRPEDATSMDFWAEPMSKLAENAVTMAFETTGLHVHISREILGATEVERQTNLSKLITFYTYYVDDDPSANEKNVKICGRPDGYSHEKPKTDIGNWLSENKLLGVVAKENINAFNKVADEVKSVCQGQRADINIKHWNDYRTIEFRKGKGIISKARLAAISGWWETMCLYVKETRPQDFSFDDFFNRACRTYPAIALYFQTIEEQ